MNTLIFIAGVLFWWVILAYSMHKDRSRYRNTVFLSLALLSTIPVIIAPLGDLQIFFALALLIVLMIVPFVLIANGVLILKREGHSLGNLLSLILGIVILLAEIGLILIVVLPYTKFDINFTEPYTRDLPLIVMIFGMSVIYGSLVFVSFMLYMLFLQIIPVKKDFDYVIIHGSGLIQGIKYQNFFLTESTRQSQFIGKTQHRPI